MTTKNEELGTDHRHDMAITTGRPGIIDHVVGPLSRSWGTGSSNRLELVLTSKDLTFRSQSTGYCPGRREAACLTRRLYFFPRWFAGELKRNPGLRTNIEHCMTMSGK